MKLLYISVCLTILVGCSGLAKTKTGDKAQMQVKETTEQNFPKGWIGNWHGELNIYAAQKTQKVPMWVEIQPIDSSKQGRYTFGLVYGSKAKDFRPYELVPLQPELGLWQVDEKNSIVMESYLRGSKFICWFVVEGSRVLCTYEMVDDQTMVFEVISGKEKAISTTGGKQPAGENEPISVVETFPVSVWQRAVLKKQNH